MSVPFANGLLLPYRTENLPGIGGQLRATARHFMVEEEPLYLPQDEGSHLYLSVTKEGLTTHELVAKLEQLFQLRRGDVGYAGLKDKFARTTQMLSIPMASGMTSASSTTIQEMVQRIGEQVPVQINWARLHRNKLKTGHLLGNHFRIVITDLNDPVDVALEKAQTIADVLRLQGLPNYFGSQRFGVHGDNPEQGREILLDQRRVRDHWLRRFLISSYQSHLCNIYLGQRLQRGLFDRMLLGDVAKKHTTGGMFEVVDAATEQARFDTHEISFTAPMFGFKMRAASAEAGALETEIMTTAGITLQQWRVARVEGTRRMGRLLLPELKISRWQDCKKENAVGGNAGEENSERENGLPAQGILAEFFLPKGAFATIVLGELMKSTQETGADRDIFAAMHDEAIQEEG